MIQGPVNLVNRTNYAVKAANNIANAVFEAILWHQGEEDAGDNPSRYSASTSTYLFDDLLPLINRFRNTSYIPSTSSNLPVVVGQLLPEWLFNVSWPSRAAGVGKALTLVNTTYAYTGFADSVDLEGCTVPGHGSGIDNSVIHFTAASQRIFGRRYLAALQLAKINHQTITNPTQPASQTDY